MEKTVSTGEAAEMLQLHPKTVTRLVKEGKLRAYQIGVHYKISVESINELIKNSIVKGENQE